MPSIINKFCDKFSICSNDAILKEIQKDIDVITNNHINHLEIDVAIVKTEIINTKDDISELKDDIRDIARDVKVVELNTAIILERISELRH